MGATRETDWPKWIMGRWRRFSLVGKEGSRMVYLRAYNEASREKKAPRIVWMAREHRRAHRHWSGMLEQRKPIPPQAN